MVRAPGLPVHPIERQAVPLGICPRNLMGDTALEFHGRESIRGEGQSGWCRQDLLLELGKAPARQGIWPQLHCERGRPEGIEQGKSPLGIVLVVLLSDEQHGLLAVGNPYEVCEGHMHHRAKSVSSVDGTSSALSSLMMS